MTMLALSMLRKEGQSLASLVSSSAFLVFHFSWLEFTYVEGLYSKGCHFLSKVTFLFTRGEGGGGGGDGELQIQPCEHLENEMH